MAERHPIQPAALDNNDPLRRVKDALTGAIVAGSTWGGIAGDLADQLDLQAALDAITKITVTAGEALGGHRAVRIAADGKAYYAAPDATARFCIGITIGAAAPGASVTIQLDGEIEEPSWSWLDSEVIWLAASGVLTQTVPASGAMLQVGVPMGPTRMRIEPEHIANL